MSTVTLPRRAQAQLAKIIRSTVRRWGPGQADGYRAALRACFAAMARRTVHTRRIDAPGGPYFRHRCRHHVIFAITTGEDIAHHFGLHERIDVQIWSGNAQWPCRCPAAPLPRFILDPSGTPRGSMMANKQKDYLAALLAEDDGPPQPSAAVEPASEAGAPPSPAPAQQAVGPRSYAPLPLPRMAGSLPTPAEQQRQRARGTTLLGRESALARVASGEVRQVTQLLLNPARVRIWPGNARSYAHLTEESCRELIDSIIAEGGQKVPAVVRRVEGDPDHDYEVIAGTRRHWSISWLRGHSYPDMQFVAQVAQIDDEAAFRLADLENRARQDVSDLERARNYAAALKDHYGSHLTRMAERLKLSKGWLSKMLKVASLPDAVIAAFASPAEVQLKPAYPLAQALDDETRAEAIRQEAKRISAEQAERRAAGKPPLPSPEVIAKLLAAGRVDDGETKLVLEGAHGRPAVSVQSANRQGVTLRLHAGHGLSEEELIDRVRDALLALEDGGLGLQR